MATEPGSPEKEPEDPRADEVASSAARDLRDQTVRSYVNAGTIHSGTNFLGNRIHGDVYLTSHNTPVATFDYGPVADELLPRYVEHRNLHEVLRELKDHSLVALDGPFGSGREALALAALRTAGAKKIAKIGSDVGPEELLETVHRLVSSGYDGFLVHRAEVRLVSGLTAAQRVRVETLGILVIITCDPHTPDHSALRSVQVQAPTIEAIAQVLAGDDEHRESIIDAARRSNQVAYEDVSAIASQASNHAGADAEELAAASRRLATRDRIQGWLAENPSTKHFASTVAGIVCQGCSAYDVLNQGWRFASTVNNDAADNPLPPKWSSTWGDFCLSILVVESQPRSTHMGVVDDMVVTCRPEVDAPAALEAIWEASPIDVRQALLAWLVDLPSGQDGGMKAAAAVATGLLFTIEPRLVERLVLRPWLERGSGLQVVCAAYATGAAPYVGRTAQPARHLVKSWSTSGSSHQRRAAVFAYGGPLGLTDPEVSASTKLWALAADSNLTRLAHENLAQLGCSGADSSSRRSRASALRMLARLCLGRPREARQAYAAAATFTETLSSNQSYARESFESLLSGLEDEAFEDLTTIWTSMLTVPIGRPAASRCVKALVRAVDSGTLSEQEIVDIVRKMRDSARRTGSLKRLGDSLLNEIRSSRTRESAGSQTAKLLLKTFFEAGAR